MTQKFGKYEIVDRIGRGGMGTVYKARDARLNRLVALKVISGEVTDELRTRFFEEAQACANLTHPNIVTIYDVGEEGDRLYIVMELLDGQELKQLIEQRVVLTIEEKLAAMAQLCDALDYAHRKEVVHRDIKPANIYFEKQGSVKIIDFGIAKTATSNSLTRTGMILGTLRYMPLEQVRGKADARSDQYSLAAVFYELLSLRPPFTGDDPIHLLEQLRTETPPSLLELCPGIPPDLVRIIERAMSKDAADRFPNLHEMYLQIEQVQRHVADEVQQLRAQYASKTNELNDLRSEIARRLGNPAEESIKLQPDTTLRLEALRGANDDVQARVQELRQKAARIDAAQPAIQRANEHVDFGRLADACTELESVLSELPDYARVQAKLEAMRVQAEELRLRQRVEALVAEARGALSSGNPSRCLALIREAFDVRVSHGLEAEISNLRDAANQMLSEQQAGQRAQHAAEEARATAKDARTRAEVAGGARLAQKTWESADRKLAEAFASFDRSNWSQALAAFEAASAEYGRAESETREAIAIERRQLEEAATVRAGMEGARGRAVSADAPRRAAQSWTEAEKKAAEGAAALTRGDHADAISAFEAAAAAYEFAISRAREAESLEKKEAERERLAREAAEQKAAIERERVRLAKEAADQKAAAERERAKLKTERMRASFQEAFAKTRTLDAGPSSAALRANIDAKEKFAAAARASSSSRRHSSIASSYASNEAP
jgi:tRNA A-37 threonylcarbamoyl transferase component Bud32